MATNRTYCGEVTIAHEGATIQVSGWVDKKRDLGGIIFLEIRDISGIVQVVCDSSHAPKAVHAGETVRSEYVVSAAGVVRRRSAETVNPNMPTGSLEILADEVTILNESDVPPIPIDIRDPVAEETRLRYRYLDLRREDMKEAVVKRHAAMQAARSFLCDNRFLEIETPILNRSTPEGARDFLVPSRLNKGMFYALPQSPQLFKQILMISGYDRYFQIVKCFRDEDLRNDRQPEFTQIDLELSFIDPDMIMEIIEGLLKDMVRAVKGTEITAPFPRMTYADSMLRYGTDAPDTRFGLEITDVGDILKNSTFNVFTATLAEGGMVRAFAVADGGKISRKMVDDYTAMLRIYGAKGMPVTRLSGGKAEGGIAKFLSPEEIAALSARFPSAEPVMVFFACDKESVVTASLANLRLAVARDLGLIDREKLNFLWVTDFPLLEYHEEDQRFYAKHHPFTAPRPDCVPLMDGLTPADGERVIAQAYDVVLNGSEIGGGSIRINNMALQKKLFGILGISDEEAAEKFSFLLEALRFGAPPHGGIALGLDRIMMLLLQRNSIRDVIPFPKTQKGQCLMSKSPSSVAPQQLKELYLKIVDK